MPKGKGKKQRKSKQKLNDHPYNSKPNKTTKKKNKNKNPFHLLTIYSDDEDLPTPPSSNIFFNQPTTRVDYVKNIKPITPQDLATNLPYEYRNFFIEKYLDPIRDTFKADQTNQNFINSLNLQKKTYKDQVEEYISVPTNKQKFDQLYDKYCFQLDYIDMVHDITNCFDYILNILMLKIL